MSLGKLRILHLTAGSDAGGLSRYLLDLSLALIDAGHEVTLAGQRGVWHDRFEAARLPWIEIPLKKGPLAFWKSVQTVRRFLADHPVDVLHAHYRRATLLGRRLQGSRPGGDRGPGGLCPPLLYTMHLSHIPLSWGRRWLTDFGDHIHVASTIAREWLISNHLAQEDQITLIPHGVHLDRFPMPAESDRASARQGLGLAEGDIAGVYMGRLDYPKNTDWLVDLADEARRRCPRLKVLLAGDGPHEAQLRQAITARGLADRIFLLGHREPLPIYHAADVLLLPSLREGFSLATAEAMCTGLPVVRTRTSGSAELIVEGVTGYTSAIDRTAFIDRVFEAIEGGPEKLTAMGQAASRHIRENFSFTRQLEQTLALYRKLAGAGA